MLILGINAYHGDSSACIFRDGYLIASIEEERLTRVKHWAGLPIQSIQFCLEEAKVDLKDIDFMTVSKNPNAKLLAKLIHALKFGNLFSVYQDKKASANNVKNLKQDICHAFGYSQNEIKASVKFIEHHLCHMACSFYHSPFKKAAIVSLDGMGDFSSLKTGLGKLNKIIPIDSVSYPNSIGYFYTCFTQFLGFPNYGDEYKVMGLSSYGNVESDLVNKLRNILKIKKNGLFELDTKYFSRIAKGDWGIVDVHGKPIIKNKFNNLIIEAFGKPRKNSEPIQDFHKNLAASVQRVTEETVFHILNMLHKQTGQDNLCLSGGVAQNSVLNGKILSNTPFKQLFVPPNAHDGGTSIGSALYQIHHKFNKSRKFDLRLTYTGGSFSDNEIGDYLSSLQDDSFYVEELDDKSLYEIVSEALSHGKIVGWYQGKSEFGPRALGNRSILADPRDGNMVEHINKKIKRRESFRPFAPSVLEEYVSDYFETNGRIPFMERVHKIKKHKQKEIPAVCHVDGTGRLQTINQSDNPRYYRLLKTFYGKTGTPILLNTSFNENEPIVNTPQEAFACFKRTEMDMLVLGNHVISRQEIMNTVFTNQVQTHHG